MIGSVTGGLEDDLVMKVKIRNDALRKIPLLWDIFEVCSYATAVR